ncbi:MAG: hypothetical protein HN751_03335 [Cryomorphaceae bacterium]|nr:hypothetical protein [Cryomorphaceae bacterium]
MKKILLVLTVLLTQNIYSQAHIGVMGGYDTAESESQIGAGLNYMLFPKVSIGGMIMISNFEKKGKEMFMLNGKYHFGRLSLVAGIMNMEMHNMDISDNMYNMDMGMNMGMSSIRKMDRETKPYFGVEYKPFKNKKLKVYYTHSDMMKSIGIMMPVFNLGKKMHMNH